MESITRHDLKPPLTVCMWAPDILKAEGNLTSTQLETIHILKQAGYSMLQIINNSINLLKMERGEYTVQMVPVNLLKPINQIKNEMSGLMRTKHLALKIYLNGRSLQESDTFIVHGEEILLYTMLSNLIKNAMEASPNDEAITVTLRDANRFTIQIHNQGTVPENIRERFFDKYVTGGKSLGTGLGTYSARMIAETLNGSIRLDTADDSGTLVTASFPK